MTKQETIRTLKEMNQNTFMAIFSHDGAIELNVCNVWMNLRENIIGNAGFSLKLSNSEKGKLMSYATGFSYMDDLGNAYELDKVNEKYIEKRYSSSNSTSNPDHISDVTNRYLLQGMAIIDKETSCFDVNKLIEEHIPEQIRTILESKSVLL